MQFVVCRALLAVSETVSHGFQGSGAGMSAEEEGVCEVSGESCGRAGEPEQDPDRGAESTERHLLPQERITEPHWLQTDEQHTHTHSLTDMLP